MKTCAIFQVFALLAVSVLASLPAYAVTVKGRVVDVETGKPVAGVHLAVGTMRRLIGDRYEVVPQKSGRRAKTCVTRKDGSFRLRRVNPDNAALISADSIWALVESTRILSRSNDRVVRLEDVRVGEGAQVFGTVFNRDYTRPMAGVVVEARWVGSKVEEIKRSKLHQTVTAEDGTFRITAIPQGDYEVGAAEEGSYRQISSVFMEETRRVFPRPGSMMETHKPLIWKQELGPLEFTVELEAPVREPIKLRTGTP
jgi:hypothetical protein